MNYKGVLIVAAMALLLAGLSAMANMSHTAVKARDYVFSPLRNAVGSGCSGGCGAALRSGRPTLLQWHWLVPTAPD
jgi:hypothetical protein